MPACKITELKKSIQNVCQSKNLLILLPYFYLGYAIFVWHESTVCHTRLYFINFILLHLLCIHPRLLLKFDTLIIALFFFWVIESKNSTEDSSCLNYKSNNFFMLTYWLFEIVLWALTFALVVLILNLLVSIIRELFIRTFYERANLSHQAIMDSLSFVKYKEYHSQYHPPPLYQEKENAPSKDRDDDECAICLENFTNEDELVIMPKCKHIFHHICIRSWVNTNKICPYCRRELVETDSSLENNFNSHVNIEMRNLNFQPRQISSGLFLH